MEDYCSICGKALENNGSSTCVGCGDTVCSEDFDSISGFCANCADNFNYCGC